MASVEELQRQLVEMKDKTKAFVLKLKEDHANEISTLKQQTQVRNNLYFNRIELA